MYVCVCGGEIGEIPRDWEVKVQDRKGRMEVPESWVAEPSLATWEHSQSSLAILGL